MKRLVSLGLVLIMLLCVMPTAFAAEEVLVPEIIVNDDMAKIDTRYVQESGNKAYLGNDDFKAGTYWGAPWGHENRFSITYDGIKLKTAKQAKGVSKTLHRRVFANKMVASHSDFRYTVKLRTYQKTEGSMQVWFAMGANQILPFMYDSKSGKLELAGKNRTAWSATTDKFIQLGENAWYWVQADFVYNSENTCYDAEYRLFDKNKTQVGETVTVPGYTYFSDITEVSNGEEPQTSLFIYAADSQADDVEYLSVKNIKIEIMNRTKRPVTFGDVKFSDTGIKLDEKCTDFDPEKVHYQDILSDEAYTSGKVWGSTNSTFDYSDESYSDGSFLWIAPNSGSYYTRAGSIRKAFKGIKGGESLSLTANISVPRLQEIKYDDNGTQRPTSYEIRMLLGNSNNTSTVNIFSYAFIANMGTRFNIGGINQGAKTEPVEEGAYKTQLYTSRFPGGQGALNDKPYSLFVTLSPSGNGKYTVYIDIEDEYGNIVKGEHYAEATLEITEEQAMALDHVEFQTNIVNNTEYVVRPKSFGIKDMKIETSASGGRTALAAGKNTVYIPYTNASDENFDAALCAAIVDRATGIQKIFSIAEYQGVAAPCGNLAIDVEVEDEETQFADFFVFDSIKGLEPLANKMSTVE